MCVVHVSRGREDSVGGNIGRVVTDITRAPNRTIHHTPNDIKRPGCSQKHKTLDSGPESSRRPEPQHWGARQPHPKESSPQKATDTHYTNASIKLNSVELN